MSIPGFIWYPAAFLVALAILVVVHELGHYWAARLCNVKVLRFSVGFGHIVFSRRRGADQTEWALGVFPLGGYVKMLDEREAPVPATELARAFNRQPLGRRAFIVAAGPLANLLLAVGLYWLVFMGGVEELRPRLALPPQGSPAAIAGIVAGEEVVAVNGVLVRSWQDLRWEALRRALDKETVELEVLAESGVRRTYRIGTDQMNLNELEQDPLRPLGLSLYRPRLPAVIGEVAPGSAAEKAGLLAGDRVLRINEESIGDWSLLAMLARESPDLLLRMEVSRAGAVRQIEVTPMKAEEAGRIVGRLGVRVKDDPALQAERFVMVRLGPVDAAIKAVRQTWETSLFSLRMLGRMLTGELSWKNLSGPVTIADYAGQSAKLGVSQYVRFLALISISLGVLNLLPIPVLDGGHLMYYLVEVIKGGPLSERVMEYGQQVGFALLALLMAFAFYNDIHRLISG